MGLTGNKFDLGNWVDLAAFSWTAFDGEEAHQNGLQKHQDRFQLATVENKQK